MTNFVMTFAREVSFGIMHERVTERELADVFEVSVSTVKRWACGKSEPLPKVKELVLSYIKGKRKTAVNDSLVDEE